MRRGSVCTTWAWRTAACALALPAPGCELTEQQRTNGGTPAVETPPAPAYAELAGLQNERVGLLQTMYSRGVVELRWIDEKGIERREEQVELDLWLKLPRRTALRMAKLGEVLLWLGSDNERFWLFDLVGEPTRLMVGPHSNSLVLQGQAAITVRPLALLDLMGLVTLHEPKGGPEPPVRYDAETDTWVVNAVGRSGMVRMHFDRNTLFPSAVTALDQAGAPVLRSELRRYAPVTLPGRPVLAFPRFPEIIRVYNAERTAEIGVFLDQPEYGTDQPYDRVFDLGRLRKAMPTEGVEDEMNP